MAEHVRRKRKTKAQIAIEEAKFVAIRQDGEGWTVMETIEPADDFWEVLKQVNEQVVDAAGQVRVCTVGALARATQTTRRTT